VEWHGRDRWRLHCMLHETSVLDSICNTIVMTPPSFSVSEHSSLSLDDVTMSPLRPIRDSGRRNWYVI
jgi:hypothetical protein